MEQKSIMRYKVAMNAGLILAVISILFAVVAWVTNLVENLGLMANIMMVLFSLLITVIMLVILTKNYRDKHLGGEINFKEAFFFGVLVVILSTVIASLYSYIFNTFIDPGYQDRIMLSMQDKLYQFMSGNGVPEDQIEAALSQMENTETPSPMQVLGSSIISGFIGGTIMSLISSAIIKKKRKDEDAFEEAMEEVKSED